MLRSMTGFGAARVEVGPLQIDVEVRSVNARALKVSVRVPTALAARESELEALVRERVRRGTVQLSVQVSSSAGSSAATVDHDVVRAFQAEFRKLGLSEDSIPLLPGVVVQRRSEQFGEAELAAVDKAVRDAVAELASMREREGEALLRILRDHAARIGELRTAVLARSPDVVREHQARLRQRVDALLAEAGTRLDDATLAREVAVLAERSDVTEELNRLEAHLEQLRELFGRDDESVGRTLEFLSQEFMREVNTVGSKSVDPEIARLVIALKTEVDRFREQVANVE